MRKLLVITALVFIAGIAFGQNKADIEKNKRIATLYHELKAENVDAILAENFKGHHEKGRGNIWDKESHRRFLSNGRYKKDSIFQQVAEEDWVATRFFREMMWNGDTAIFEAMHFKRFEDGKIAEIWEYADTQQAEY